MSEVITDRAERILAFLQECENELWDLDNDDISHVLSMDFDYIRKGNTIAESYDTVEEAIEGLKKSIPKSEDGKA